MRLRSLHLFHSCLCQDQVNWCLVMHPAADGSRSANAADSCPCQQESKAAPHPAHNPAVPFIALHGKVIGQLLHNHHSLLAHASSSCENKRCEGAVFYFSYPLPVFSLLITLHLPKQRLKGLGPVASRVWVKNLSVKKCVTALGPARTRMSALASWTVLAVRCRSDSPVRGCNFGSTSMSL